MEIPGSPGKSFGNFNELLKLAKDENFQKFLSNPKVQILMRNEEFKRAVQEKNIFKLLENAEFRELLEDPEIRAALEKVNKKFSNPS